MKGEIFETFSYKTQTKIFMQFKIIYVVTSIESLHFKTEKEKDENRKIHTRCSQYKFETNPKIWDDNTFIKVFLTLLDVYKRKKEKLFIKLKVVNVNKIF